MRTAVLKVVVVGLILCARSTVGIAGEDPETLIRQGIALRKAGDDARAEGYFRRAYDLAATSRTAAQLGLVELAVSDYIHAEEHLTEALGYRDAWILENLAALKGSRDVARRNLFHVEMVGAPPNATVTLEGASPRPLPPGGIVWIDAGRSATIRIEAPGCQPAVLRISGAAGAGRRIAVEMQPLARDRAVGSGVEPPPPTVADRSSTDRSSGNALRIAGLATAVVGVAAGVLGAVLYKQGTNKLHDYQAAVKSDGKIPWNPNDDNWEGTRNTGVTLLIAGGVAAAAGVTLFVVGKRHPNDETVGGQVSFLPQAGGGFFSYRGRF